MADNELNRGDQADCEWGGSHRQDEGGTATTVAGATVRRWGLILDLVEGPP